MPLKLFSISDLFSVKSGDFHAMTELDSGNIPLVSCGEENNGVIGNFNIPEDRIYERCLTVAYNGWPLSTKYHPYRFGAKDDVGVLIPKHPMPEALLLFVASVLSREKWRYSYGRKCFREKIESVKIPLPVGDDGKIDEGTINRLIPNALKTYIPESQQEKIDAGHIRWGRFRITKLFTLDHGDFNSYGDFDDGDKMIISRSAENNGLVGYYKPPEDARRFPIGTITVSTVTGDAFVQLHDFYASDKVVLLNPRIKIRPTTLFFVSFSLNHQKWRFSYGRSCFKRTLSLAAIYLPIDRDGNPDEDAMENIVKKTSYWNIVGKRFPHFAK